MQEPGSDHALQVAYWVVEERTQSSSHFKNMVGVSDMGIEAHGLSDGYLPKFGKEGTSSLIYTNALSETRTRKPMTEPLNQMNEDRRILRWAGLAGIIGVIMAILSLIVNATLVPIFVQTPSGCGPACNVDATLTNFPTVKAPIVAANAFYFVSIILFAILFLGL